MVNYPLFSLIAFAYKLTGYQEELLRSRAPDWVLSDRFDVQARAAGNPTKDELRHKVQKLTPRKKKEPKRTTTGKVSKRKSKPEPPPYEPSAEEQAKLDSVEDKALELADAIKSGGVFKIAAELDNKEKRRWIAMFEPFVMFYNNLDRLTGY